MNPTPARWLKSSLKDNRGLLVFLLCLAFFRTAVADWNPIPTGSMRPTLLEGDVVLVDRLAYDLKLPLSHVILQRLGEPQRGDVVTFDSPRDGKRLIKRVVGVPGDVLQMHDGQLKVNGQAAAYNHQAEHIETLAPGLNVRALQLTEEVGGSQRRVQYLAGARAARDFGPLTLHADQFYMLGDNRDNSDDSRYLGVVERRLIIGRAHRVLVSADIPGHGLPRWRRFGGAIQ